MQIFRDVVKEEQKAIADTEASAVQAKSKVAEFQKALQDQQLTQELQHTNIREWRGQEKQQAHADATFHSKRDDENTNDDETTCNDTNASASSRATPDRPTNEVTEDTPRRLARKRALEFAKDLESAKKRSVVVGRPSWPADERN